MIDFEISCPQMKTEDLFKQHNPIYYDNCCCGVGCTKKAAFEDCLDALSRCMTLDHELRHRIQIEYNAITGQIEHGYYYVKIQWS